MKARIKDIAYYLPERTISNDQLYRENPGWDMRLVEEHAGVVKRHVADNNQTALDLSLQACKNIFYKNRGAKEQIDGIIFCTQSEDYILPSNSCVLHGMLGLPEDVLAFDLNLACSGYIYGLALAQGLITAGIARNILLINADTYSKYINKNDRSVRVLFSDGAAVTWITNSESTQGIIDIRCSTSGKHYDKFIIPAGGCRIPKSTKTAIPKIDQSGNMRTLENIHMDGMGILVFINSKVPGQIKDILAQNKMAMDDIDLFVFHQASRISLDSLTRLLKLKPERVYRNIREIGNTVSASIPIALKEAMENGRVSKGDKILLSGFGVGLSWGTAIIEL